MKKLLSIVLLAIITTITACGTDRIFTNPAGVLQRADYTEESHEEYDGYEDIISQIQQRPPAPIDSSPQTLRLSMRHPLTLNPLLNEDVTVARVLRLLFEPLIVLDENLRPTSHLAEIELSTDLYSAIVAIRSDAFWSDGRPVSSDDLIFSVETLRNAPDHAIYRNNVENIASITRLNARNVQIYFHVASACVGIDLGFPIVPRHVYQGLGVAACFNPVGNGSFLFESYTPMRYVRLVQNTQSFRQIAQISEVEVIFLPNHMSELYAFDQGRIDAIYMPLTEWARHHSVRQPHFEMFPAMYFEFIGFNFHNEIFDNLQMRQGIARAFDACEAVRAVYLNHAVRAVSPIHPYSFIAGDVRQLEYDPTRASILLNAVPVEHVLEIIVNDDNPQRVGIANRLAESLNDIGLSAEVAALPYIDYFLRLENGEFDLFIGGMNLALVPDVAFFFHERGYFLVEDEVLEAAFAATTFFFNEAAYLRYMEQFQQVFADRLPVISLAFRHSAVLTGMGVTQNVAPAPDNIFGWVNLWRV